MGFGLTSIDRTGFDWASFDQTMVFIEAFPQPILAVRTVAA
jgi:hypothetical protein